MRKQSVSAGAALAVPSWFCAHAGAPPARRLCCAAGLRGRPAARPPHPTLLCPGDECWSQNLSCTSLALLSALICSRPGCVHAARGHAADWGPQGRDRGLRQRHARHRAVSALCCAALRCAACWGLERCKRRKAVLDLPWTAASARRRLRLDCTQAQHLLTSLGPRFLSTIPAA